MDVHKVIDRFMEAQPLSPEWVAARDQMEMTLGEEYCPEHVEQMMGTLLKVAEVRRRMRNATSVAEVKAASREGRHAALAGLSWSARLVVRTRLLLWSVTRRQPSGASRED